MTLFIVLTKQVIMRVSGLALMTDQAVAVVLSPALLLWEAEPVIGGRKVGRYLDMAAREWNLFFKDNINNRLNGDYVQHIFNFLNGQNQTLRKLADQKISSNFGYHLNRSDVRRVTSSLEKSRLRRHVMVSLCLFAMCVLGWTLVQSLPRIPPGRIVSKELCVI